MTAKASEPHIGLIVEGPGDLAALPILLRSHLHASGDHRDVLGKPIPVHGRPNALKEGGVEGFAAIAGSRPGCVGMLIVFDSDLDSPNLLRSTLQQRAQSKVGQPVRVALAVRDFEDWLYASAETLQLNLAFNAQERGLSEISDAVPGKYVKPTWQPRLAARVDLSIASARAPSLNDALTAFDELRECLP